MVDYTARKVPIFPGKNDIPRIPTAEKEGNASDLIARFNGFVDDVSATNSVAIAIKDSFQDNLIGNNIDIEFNHSIINTLSGFNGITFIAPSDGVYRVSTLVKLAMADITGPSYLLGMITLHGGIRTYDTFNTDTLPLASQYAPIGAGSIEFYLNASCVLHLAEDDDFKIRANGYAGSGSSGSFHVQHGRIAIEQLAYNYTVPSA